MQTLFAAGESNLRAGKFTGNGPDDGQAGTFRES
jgi:hypothetical protein